MSGEYLKRERLEINFAQVPKSALKDKNLSLKAKGLYAYLFSLPEDWKVYKTEVVKNFSDGKDSLNAAFKELEKNGYLISKSIRESGKFQGTELTLLIEPLRENRNGETVDGNTVVGKSATTNTDINKKRSSNKILSIDKEIYNDFPFFDSEFKNVWDDYLKMRISIKKKATPKAEELALQKVSEFSKGDKARALKIVENSILNSYVGIWDIKDDHAPINNQLSLTGELQQPKTGAQL